jgi:TonB family protein
LFVGRQLGYSVNPAGVVEQVRRVKGSIFAFLARVISPYPHLVTRYVDLIAFARRRFPEQFARFDAENPGLPRDLDELSGERTSGSSYAKGALAILGYYAALIAMVAFWIAVAVWVIGKTAAERTPQSAIAEGLAAPDASAAAPAAAPAPEPQAPPSREIAEPVVEQQPSAEDFQRVYPDAALRAGVSGSATIRCLVTAEGRMDACAATDETPADSGFGDAAVRLADRIKIAPQDKSGASVAGGHVSLNVPFNLPQQP